MASPAQLERLRREVGELLERHARARDLSEFARYKDDPVGFIRDVLKGDPWSMQAEIAERVRDHPLVVVRSCNGAGKDWLAARVALWWIYAVGGYVLSSAPTQRQLQAVVMGELRNAFHRAQDLPGELFEMALRVDRDERVGLLAFTSSEASRLTGFHAPKLMVLMTEAQGVEEFAWEAMHANLTGAESRFLAVGNPLAPTGRFFAVSQSEDWQRIRIQADDHPNIREGREIIPGGIAPGFVNRVAREYGRNSGIYCSRVLGEFPTSSEDGLVDRKWLDKAADQCPRFAAEFAEEEPVAAIDPARMGPDSTVLAVRKGPAVTEVVTWRRMDTMELTGRLQHELKRMGFRANRKQWIPPGQRGWIKSAVRAEGGRGRVVIDEVGLGAAVLDRLRELGFKVKGFNGGRSPHDKKRFSNLRSETFWHLRELLESGKIGIPADERLADELVATSWRPDSAGRVTIEPKDDLRGRLGRSPDRADAIAMLFSEYASRRQIPKLDPLHW